MKQLLILIALFTFCTLSPAQNVKRAKFKRTVTEYPTIPMENVEKVNVSIYSPDPNITLDMIRDYGGTVKILTGGGLGYSGASGRSYNPLTLTNSGWDLNLEVAFFQPQVVDKTVFTSQATNLLGDKVTRYAYALKMQVPAIAKITDPQGKILDIWSVADTIKLNFGDENITTRNEEEEGGGVTVQFNYYNTEEDLEKGFQTDGPVFNNKRALLSQLRNALDGFYNRIYFRSTTDTYKIATGKSKNYDYSELDAAMDEAVQILEDGNAEDLSKSIAVWEKYLEQSDLVNRKAMINKRMTAALNGNLALAHMYRNEYEKAQQYYEVYARMSGGNGTMTTQTGLVSDQDKLKANLYYRSLAHTANGHLNISGRLVEGYDFKKAIGREGPHDNPDIYKIADKYGEFANDYNSFYDLQAAAAGEDDPFGPSNLSYAERAQAQVATQGWVLGLDPYSDPDIVGKAFPEEILELTPLGILMAPDMQFTSLPENIGVLNKLVRLNLKGNNLTSIPESIGQLSKLKMLNVKNNQLTSLPESIKNCTKLKTLHISGNNISDAEMAKIKGWIPEKCKIK